MTAPFQSDPRYVRFLAERPGLWCEVGVLDDRGFLDALRAERGTLGLPDLVDRLPIRRRRARRAA